MSTVRVHPTVHTLGMHACNEKSFQIMHTTMQNKCETEVNFGARFALFGVRPVHAAFSESDFIIES